VQAGTTLDPEMVYQFTGEFEEYKGARQFIVRKWSKKPKAPTEPYLARSRYPVEILDRDLTAVIDSLDEDLADVVYDIFNLKPERKAFLAAPAASGMHHAYVGGLVEHTLGVVKIVDTLCMANTTLDRDLAVAGAILHDLGKVGAYRVAPGFPMTDRGKLEDHIVIGYDFVRQFLPAKWTKGKLKSLRQHLLHIILSHHGRKEWGSPVQPQTPEAILVFQADYTDSRVGGALEALELGLELGMDWTDRVGILDGARLWTADRREEFEDV
jgi:3'-5' exoribonuclease